MKSQFELKNIQIKKLYNVMNLCIILKSISSSDIHYENGKILYINGITFSKGKYKVDIDIYKNIDS